MAERTTEFGPPGQCDDGASARRYNLRSCGNPGATDSTPSTLPESPTAPDLTRWVSGPPLDLGKPSAVETTLSPPVLTPQEGTAVAPVDRHTSGGEIQTNSRMGGGFPGERTAEEVTYTPNQQSRKPILIPSPARNLTHV